MEQEDKFYFRIEDTLTWKLYQERLARGLVEKVPRYWAELVFGYFMNETNMPDRFSVSAYGETVEEAKAKLRAKVIDMVDKAMA